MGNGIKIIVKCSEDSATVLAPNPKASCDKVVCTIKRDDDPVEAAIKVIEGFGFDAEIE
jgi:hypothetical protein